MIILPWLFLNLVLGQDALNPDLSTGTLATTSLAQSEFSRVLDPFNFGPWRFQHVANITRDDDDVKIIVNVQQYEPEEVTVKVVGHFVVIKAKHEEQDGTNIKSQLMLIYILPKDVDVDNVTHSISDGILTIKAPWKSVDEKEIPSTTPSNSVEQVGTEEAAVEQANV